MDNLKMDKLTTPIAIRDYLRNFAEENKAEMSVNVYNGIWNLIQSIEHDLKELSNEDN